MPPKTAVNLVQQLEIEETPLLTAVMSQKFAVNSVQQPKTGENEGKIAAITPQTAAVMKKISKDNRGKSKQAFQATTSGAEEVMTLDDASSPVDTSDGHIDALLRAISTSRGSYMQRLRQALPRSSGNPKKMNFDELLKAHSTNRLEMVQHLERMIATEKEETMKIEQGKNAKALQVPPQDLPSHAWPPLQETKR